VAAIAALGVLSAPATARVFNGSSSANRVVGTKKADRIVLKAGNDRARGLGGADRIFGGAGKDRLRGDAGGDRLSGGKGRDQLIGGKGRDRFDGGAGNDVINAVDRRKDARVNGGAGRNICRIDPADLAVAKRCSKIVVVRGPGAPGGGGTGGGGTGGGTGGGGGGDGGGGTGGGTDGAAGPLALSSGEGLSCASALPTCVFTLEGTGADTLTGTVTGEGGVETAAGAAVAAQGDDWTAAGSYGCTSDGALVVTVGVEVLRVPITCGR